MSNKALNWAFEQFITRSVDKLVLVVIANRANEHWAAFPGKAEIARKATIAESSVVHCVRRLEQGGFLMRVPFEAAYGQDQKIGYVLAGGPRKLDEVDEEYLEMAFADRKQAGAPKATKPAHWSGARKSKPKEGQGYQTVTLAGLPTDNPQGDQTVTPRTLSKNQEEEETEQPSATAQARDRSRPPSNPPAIAEVAAIAEAPAGAGALTNGKSAGKAGKEGCRSDTRQRDDSWRLQLQAADLDDLYDALASYHNERQGLEAWAYRTAASDLGIDFGADEPIPEQADGDWTRATYLYLLKKHDQDPGDGEIQSALLEPLDSSIQASERPYRKVEKLPPPAGVSPREFADQMKAAVTLMEPAEIGPYIAEFREARRGVWWESLAKAEELLRARKQKVTAQAKNYVALHVAIDRYVDRGTWEMELVPPSMRSQSWQSTGEAPPWAA